MRMRWTALCAPACCVLFWAAPAGATLLFVVDSSSSSLGVANATFAGAPGFDTTLEPVTPDDWIRPLAGMFEADETTGALESAAIQILGAPLVGDQIRMDSGGNPRDFGDIVLAALAFSVDAAGIATFTAGTIDYDLSLGGLRISSPFPFSIAGVSSATSNQGAPPMLNGVMLTVPILISFQDVAIEGGTASFDLVGTLHGTVVPEPATGLLMALGLVAVCGRRRRNC